MKKVKIKTWDSMAEEFGCDFLCSIDVPHESFTTEMEGLMPRDRIIDIEEIDNGGVMMYVWTLPDGDDWFITDDMIEYEVNTSNLMADFFEYASRHPEQRFWQALRNWSGHSFIYVSEEPLDRIFSNEDLKDTFYMGGK